MRLPVAVLALACLAAGCATSPDDMRASATPIELSSQQPPRSAASCMARQADELTEGGMATSMREASTPGAWEVVVNSGSGIFGVFALMEARPRGAGSSLSMWLPRIALDSVVRRWVEAMKRC